MEFGLEEGPSSKRRRTVVDETGPYILRILAENVALTAEESAESPQITSVELWNENLYIGTSKAEILHYVLIESDPSDSFAAPTPILASRLQPPFVSPTPSSLPDQGVQQILLLPTVLKACVLCNGTLTFYSLPELSPAFGTTRVRNCVWIGGIDQDLNGGIEERTDGNEHMMIGFKDRIQLVRVGESEKPRSVKNIDYGGSLAIARRSRIACVANTTSYALLDIDQQQKISLFPISSLNQAIEAADDGRVEDSSIAGDRRLSSTFTASLQRPSDHSHGRSTSLGNLVGNLGRRQPSPRSRTVSNVDIPEQSSPDDMTETSSSARRLSPSPARPFSSASNERSLPTPPSESSESRSHSRQVSETSQQPFLKPHVLSPRSGEFLLATGTTYSEAGVGMFVDSDGDVFRSTLEFGRYPKTLILDGLGVDSIVQPANLDENQEGFVLAVMEGGPHSPLKEEGIEIQRWDVDGAEGASSKTWLEVPPSTRASTAMRSQLGLRKISGSHRVSIGQVCQRLRLNRLKIPRTASTASSATSTGSCDSRTKESLEQVRRETELFDSHASVQHADDVATSDKPLPLEWESRRMREEEQFARGLGNANGHIIAWSADQIYWVLKTPLAVRLDAALGVAGGLAIPNGLPLDRRKVIEVLDSIRNQEPSTEADFLSLGYIRQKASLLLFADALLAAAQSVSIGPEEWRVTGEALIEGGLDPRVVLMMLPILREEVIEGRTGVWIHEGVKVIAEALLSSKASDDVAMLLTREMLTLLRYYLMAWRRKKGFGSIADETEIFQSVDAALLRVLLRLDETTADEGSSISPIRAELYALNDHGVDCFHRAVDLLEDAERLYVLSRLYQSRKQYRMVLATWKRMLDGEGDELGEFANGEVEMRRYLSKIRDSSVVEEYGTWLAERNPRLGVQVFADEDSRVKFEPAQVVRILTAKAPDAVKEYLEYLVFGKHHTQYTNDLIGFYLDTVISTLETTEEARSILLQSYKNYRALRPPRPTYRQFISDNAIDEEWWSSRLRLLQLLGGEHGAAANYDVSAVLSRIEPFEQELVPEMIILDGRQARHPQALRLLTRGLGDYDTAINYCLYGGSSMYRPDRSSSEQQQRSIPTREEQVELFEYLLPQFLQIDDPSDRIEQTSNLLERFGGWYDVHQVLTMIPDSWPVDLLAPFLISSFRRVLEERNETMIAKALSGAENLLSRANLIDFCEKAGPTVEGASTALLQ